MAKNTTIEFSSLQRDVLKTLGVDSIGLQKSKKKISLDFVEQTFSHKEKTLAKSILNVLDGPDGSIERLAFEVIPEQSQFGCLWVQKQYLLPDEILKRVSIQDSLIAAIVNTRSNQIAAFGRPQPDRFSTGMRIEPEPHYSAKLDAEGKKKLQERIAEVEALILTCGNTKGWKDENSLGLSQFLFQITRNAVVFGRIAVEVIWVEGPGGTKFHSFRPIDAGTIYKTRPFQDQAESVRQQAKILLEQVNNKELNAERYVANDYAWVQVINGRPSQVFTGDECLCHNFYPVPDVELNGYPVTPLDTVISDVTMHINIVKHNAKYFESGRAARGMLVIKSDDADENVVGYVRQQFHASINGTGNAWRMPVFGVGVNEEISWQPIDNSSRDMEFQYLSDTNSRVILSAFQMSPEELPGYAHLCLHPDTTVWTDSGVKTIGQILGDSHEVGGFKVWTGKEFCSARAFVTGQRQRCVTRISNGCSVSSSPDHLFRVVGEDGDVAWKKQCDLVIGDTVLVNKTPVPHTQKMPEYQGKSLTNEMMEVLGWLSGDGSILVSSRGKIKHSKSLCFYYHPEKEQNILESHFNIMRNFGLNPIKVVKHRTDAQIERQKEKFGFKNVRSTRTELAVYDTEFVEWLLGLGFTPSNQEKAIPDFLHSLPLDARGAFLRGFFSADGSIDALNTPTISISAESTREATKKLLTGMGIRVRNCEGTHRTTFVRDGNKFSQQYIKAPSRLVIKDKTEFFNLIGFLQPHKQPNPDVMGRSSRRWHKVDKRVAGRLCGELLGEVGLVRGEDRDIVRHALCDSESPYREYDKVRAIASKYGKELPAWVSDFYQETVVGLEKTDIHDEMVDIEVHNEEHAFVANGVVVHNSRGTNSQSLSETNNEFVLEGHRDIGIRPLLAQIQNFFNSKILPLVAPDLAKFCSLKFVGLDVDTAEKESTRLQQDMAVHMSYDEVREKVEKDPIGREWGGQFPLNPQIQSVLDKYMLVGDIKAHFFGDVKAKDDPRFQFVANPLWFQWQQLLMQQQQMQAQAQQMQMQQSQGQAQQGPQDQQNQQGPQDQSQDQQGPQDQQNQPQSPQESQSQPEDLSRSADQLATALGKSTSDKTPWTKKALLHHQRALVTKVIEGFERDAEEATKSITKIVEEHLPRR